MLQVCGCYNGASFVTSAKISNLYSQRISASKVVMADISFFMTPEAAKDKIYTGNTITVAYTNMQSKITI